MCGRFTLTSPADQIQDLFGVAQLPLLEPHYNVAPTQDVLAIRGGTNGREAELLRWGMVPRWAKDISIGARFINARSETVDSKSAFREAFAERRCLVVADGFFEWEKLAKYKQPHWFRLTSGDPFAFAGLWARWRAPDNSILESCTVITTEPNELVAPYHDRMPVMLHAHDYDLWLDADAQPADLKGLLTPFPAELMTDTPVNRRVNSVQNDDPSCIEPVHSAPSQGTLF